MRYAVVRHDSLYASGSFRVPTNETVERFEVGADAISHLRQEGYVVVRGVLNATELIHARELLWAFMEGTAQGVRRDDPMSWAANGPNPYGIFWGFGAGHSRLLWFIRTRPVLLRMFELVWGTSDLISSFEAFSMFPPRRAELRWRLGESWFHTDQNGRSRPGLQTVQSFTSLYDQDEATGAFVVRLRPPCEYD